MKDSDWLNGSDIIVAADEQSNTARGRIQIYIRNQQHLPNPVLRRNRRWYNDILRSVTFSLHNP